MSGSGVELAFGPDSVRLGETAESWRDAVRRTGELLVATGSTTAGYTKRMIEVIEAFGPYMVVAPGLALVHARPGPDVLRNGAAILTFPEGVRFGHRRNDPVRAVIGLAVRRPEEHVTIVAAIARVLDEPGVVDQLLDPTDAAELAAGVVERLAREDEVVVAPVGDRP